MPLFRPAVLIALLLLLAGCDQLGLETATAINGRKEAEGRAVGGACRHAGRAIEDCYALNKKADKAAIFAGWREMNDYMRENKIDTVPPTQAATAVAAKADEEPAPDSAGAKKKPAVVREAADKHGG